MAGRGEGWKETTILPVFGQLDAGGFPASDITAVLDHHVLTHAAALHVSDLPTTTTPAFSSPVEGHSLIYSFIY